MNVSEQRTARRVAQRYLSAVGGRDAGLLVEADVLDEVSVLGRRLVHRLVLDPEMQVGEIIERANEIVRVAEEAKRVIPF